MSVKPIGFIQGIPPQAKLYEDDVSSPVMITKGNAVQYRRTMILLGICSIQGLDQVDQQRDSDLRGSFDQEITYIMQIERDGNDTA